MNALRRFSGAWTAFWFKEGPPHALAIMRALFGAFWLIRFLWFLPDVRLLFSSEGWHFPFVEYPVGMVDLTTGVFGALCQPVPGWLAVVLYTFTVLTTIGMMIGYQTRLAIGAFQLMYMYYYFLYFHMTNSSYDRMLFVLMGLLLLSPCGTALSVDSYLARKDGKPFAETQALWTARVIAVHLAVMYFGAGLFKIVSPSWDTGEVVGTALISEWGTSLAFHFVRLGWTWGVYDLAVIGTILFELGMGFLLFHPRWQKAAFVIGTIFHLQIWVMLDIPQFMFMPMCYVVYAEPDAVRDAALRLLAKVTGRRSAGSALS